MMHTFFSYVANFIILLWLFCAIMVNLGMCSLRVQCNEKDRDILLNFKYSITDPSTILSTWNVKQNCCQWTGVQCDNSTGRVIELSLPCSSYYPHYGYGSEEDKSHCLTGEFNLSLLQIEFLGHLDLSNNDFNSIQYDSFGNSSNLHFLDLSYNDNLHIDNLQWLSHVSSLKYINFSGVDLHKETNWLQLVIMLPSLLELHLGSCQLKNINPSLQFANFTSLEVLDLSNNAFGSQILPKWLFNLSGDIFDINLSGNLFRGQLPKTFLNHQSLISLDLSGNKLSGPMPNWLGQFEHLQYLELSFNSFFGPIPRTLGNLSSLVELDIASNLLNGSLPESLGQLSNLIRIALDDNPLTGIVSERNFVKLSNLKYLSLGSPEFFFDFDSFWVPPFQLKLIWLTYVVPELPAWLYTQTSLRYLAIFNSRISFETHNVFWNFAAQTLYLQLEYITIDGDMSNVWLNSTVTILSSNKIKGSLPQLSSNVEFFSIANNSISGSLSSLLCHKINEGSQLVYLDISNNLLSEGLTDCWMKWKLLVHVNLGNNNLTSKIPSSMSFLSKLMTLHLNKNNLFGEIPMLLKNCPNLLIVNLAENNFSGNIPNWIGQRIVHLQLRSNQFSGNIPSQICQLSSLRILDFAYNKISGPIPRCLYNMTMMVFNNSGQNDAIFFFYDSRNVSFVFFDILMLLTKGQREEYEKNLNLMRLIDFSNNNLSGPIPSEIVNLTGLISLNLSHNQLVGNIPRDIGNLKQLESFDLSSNKLSSEIPQSMAELSFLSSLNLSFNNFSGKIPSGTQLEGFSTISYIGNPKLCGTPLPKSCIHEEDVKPNKENGSNDFEILSSFYIGMGVGFAIGFWGVCGAIFFNKTFRHSYFRFLDHVKDKLYVMVILKIKRFH